MENDDGMLHCPEGHDLGARTVSMTVEEYEQMMREVVWRGRPDRPGHTLVTMAADQVRAGSINGNAFTVEVYGVDLNDFVRRLTPAQRASLLVAPAVSNAEILEAVKARGLMQPIHPEKAGEFIRVMDAEMRKGLCVPSSLMASETPNRDNAVVSGVTLPSEKGLSSPQADPVPPEAKS